MDHRDGLNVYEENVERVNAAVKRFLASEPHRFTGYYDKNTREYLVQVRVIKSPPPGLRSLVGNTLGGLRSSLDYLAGAVVHANGKPKYPQRIQFPIFDTPDRYLKDGIGKRGQVAEASATARTAFEELQPYQGGNPADHPLWILHELARKHRHREPVLTAAAAAGSTGTITVAGVPFQALTFGGGPFKDGTVLIRVRMALPPGSKVLPPMQVHAHVSVAVAFAEEGPARGRPLINGMNEIRDHIRDVVFPKLEGFL